MAQVCELCDKSTERGNSRSHSNRAIKRKFRINLQKITMNGKTQKICMRCLKSLHKQK